METIKLYLENMFMNLPNNEQVAKAKRELLAMMEDKYNELKADGKTENEAVGIVISEFGNLDEIAEELGIKDTVALAAEMPKGKLISLETVKEYLSVNAINARRIAIGVFMCICSPILVIILGGMSKENMGLTEKAADAIGVSVLLILVAIAVAIFVYSGMKLAKYEYLQKETFQMDYSVKQYLMQLQDSHKSTFALHITIGVVICIISVVPVVVLGCIDSENEMLMSVAVGVMLFMIAIAVMFFITSGMQEGAYKILLQQDEYAPEEKDDKRMKAVTSIYWSVITAAYLLWSFIAMDWSRSWIIWPIAGVIYGIIATVAKEKRSK